jgi:hypothetical protein
MGWGVAPLEVDVSILISIFPFGSTLIIYLKTNQSRALNATAPEYLACEAFDVVALTFCMIG